MLLHNMIHFLGLSNPNKHQIKKDRVLLHSLGRNFLHFDKNLIRLDPIS